MPQDLTFMYVYTFMHVRTKIYTYNIYIPFQFHSREVIALCQKEGIFYQSFSTLGRQWLQGRQPTRDDPNPVLGHPTVLEISRRLGKTAAQVALKWALNSGLGVIPKSSKG